jgi:hypothetical protein
MSYILLVMWLAGSGNSLHWETVYGGTFYSLEACNEAKAFVTTPDPFTRSRRTLASCFPKGRN